MARQHRISRAVEWRLNNNNALNEGSLMKIIMCHVGLYFHCTVFPHDLRDICTKDERCASCLHNILNIYTFYCIYYF